MTIVKICGITSPRDAAAAPAAGADAIGLVFAPGSRRRVDLEGAAACTAELPDTLIRVGVFVDADPAAIADAVAAAGLDVVQLHGQENDDDCAGSPRPVWKRIPVTRDDDPATLRAGAARFPGCAAILIDPGSGDGRTFSWKIARDLPGKVVLAGGLTPGNVAEAIREARPWGVDVSTGVESSPGRKDEGKMRAFVAAVRREEARRAG